MSLTRGVLSQIFFRGGCRSFQTHPVIWGAAKAEKKSSPLGALRKKTGYSLTLCKQALAANEQNLERAEKWLEEQAQAQGWSKAQKLEGRNTAQGLIGLYVEGNSGAMIELNCETDFVAKNTKFHSLLNEIAAAKFQHLKANPAPSGDISIQLWDKDRLSSLKSESGKSLSDLVALYIGQIGENIVLRRGVTFSCQKDGHRLIGLTHPSGSITSTNRVQYGRYGTLLAYAKDPNSGLIPEGQTVESMARQLCQHVIGMNPKSVGNFDDKSTWPTAVKPEAPKATVRDPSQPRPEGESEEDDISSMEVDTSVLNTEDVFIHQSFLMDSEVLVRDVLQETGLRIESFVRFEVGQSG